MDHYERLGVARDADERAVARAFRRAARDVHPDRGGDAERFLALEEAYRVLSDPVRRRAYDRELNGRALDWDDVGWGASVAPDVARRGVQDDQPPEDAGPEPDDLDWDEDPGWGEVRDGDPAPAGGPWQPDPFVGGPVRLPDPLVSPAAGVPLPAPTRAEWAFGVVAVVLLVVAAVTRVLALRSGAVMAAPGEVADPRTAPLTGSVWLAVSVALHVRATRSSAGVRLAWLLTAVAALSWFVDLDVLEWTALVGASTVAGPLAALLAVLWGRSYGRRRYDPARLAALQKQSVGWRIDRHHRAEEWNRVRAALQQAGRTAVLVGPPARDSLGRPVRNRRWTFDPRTGAQKVRVIGQTSPQGSWVVVDARGRVVATAPAWSMEAWLDALQESEQMSPQASTGART